MTVTVLCNHSCPLFSKYQCTRSQNVLHNGIVAARPLPIPSVADAFPIFVCIDSRSPYLPTSPATFSRSEAGNFLLAGNLVALKPAIFTSPATWPPQRSATFYKPGHLPGPFTARHYKRPWRKFSRTHADADRRSDREKVESVGVVKVS